MKSEEEIRKRLKRDREWLDHPNNHGDKTFQEGFIWALRWVLGEFEDGDSAELEDVLQEGQP